MERVTLWLRDMVGVLGRASRDLGGEHRGVRPRDRPSYLRARRAGVGSWAQSLKGRPLDLLKTVSKSNGFESYRILIQEYDPKTKNRTLGMLQSITSPTFGKDPTQCMIDFGQMGERDKTVRRAER